MKKGIIAIICSIISFIIILICFIFPWYNIHYNEEPESSSYYINDTYDYREANKEKIYNTDFLLNSFKSSQDAYGLKYSASFKYSDYKEMMENNPSSFSTSQDSLSKFEDMEFIYNTTFYILISILIIAIISLIITIFSILPTKYFKTLKNLGFISNLLLFIMIIILAFYFFFSWDSYIQNGYPNQFVTSRFDSSQEKLGFWYSKSESNYKFNMGPSYAWYLLFVSGALSLISSILVFLNKSPWIPTIQQMKPTYYSNYPLSSDYVQQNRY